MSAIVVDISERASHGDKIVFRVTLARQRAYRVPQVPCRVRVLRGVVWLTFDDEDYVFQSGRSFDLEPAKYGTVISALGDEPLIFEVASREPVAYDRFMEGLAQISTPRQSALAWLARRAGWS